METPAPVYFWLAVKATNQPDFLCYILQDCDELLDSWLEHNNALMQHSGADDLLVLDSDQEATIELDDLRCFCGSVIECTKVDTQSRDIPENQKRHPMRSTTSITNVINHKVLFSIRLPVGI